MVFSSCCFVMSLFYSGCRQASLPSSLLSFLRPMMFLTNHHHPSTSFVPQTNPGALNTQRRELYIQLSIYLLVYNPMASSSCPYLANLDNLAIPVASLVMLISFTCSYLPILIITRRACHLCDVQCAQ